MRTGHGDAGVAALLATAVGLTSRCESLPRKSVGIRSQRVLLLAVTESTSRQAIVRGVPRNAPLETSAPQLLAMRKAVAKNRVADAPDVVASGRCCRYPTPNLTVRHVNRRATGRTAILDQHAARNAADVTVGRGATVVKSHAANVVPVHRVLKKAALGSLGAPTADPTSMSLASRMTTNWQALAAICWRKSARLVAEKTMGQAVRADAAAAADGVEQARAVRKYSALTNLRAAKRIPTRTIPGLRSALPPSSMTTTRMTTRQNSSGGVPVAVEAEDHGVKPQRARAAKSLRQVAMSRRAPNASWPPSNIARRHGSKPSRCSSTQISNAAAVVGVTATAVPHAAPMEAAAGGVNRRAASCDFS